MHKLIFISGATASGKSGFVHGLIDKYFPRASILSVDSIQVYKMLSVGSAKPSDDEVQKYNYKLVDLIDPKTNFSVNDYLNIAASEIPKANKPIFAVGGTGFYFNALKYGLFEEPSDDSGEIRQKLYADYEQHGLDYMLNLLKNIDIDSYNSIDIHNIRKVVRALEVYYKTGRKFSDIKNDRKQVIPIDYLHYAIDIDRQVLYNNINTRVLKMFELGLLDEVSSIIDSGVPKDSTAMAAIGYKECYEYLVDKTIDYDRLVYNVQINTRHFAKRQLTWFRRDSDIKWINPNDENIMENIAKEVGQFCNI